MSLLQTQVSYEEPYDNKGLETEMAQGMAISKPILEQTLDEYRKQMSVNGTLSRRLSTSEFSANCL
jgi:hypothetical protein